MTSDPLASALGRLQAFRTSFSAGELVDPASNLSSDDLDLILARLFSSTGQQIDLESTYVQGLNFSDHPTRLSDSHLAGTHYAMQDGVDDDRKAALGDEMERRRQVS